MLKIFKTFRAMVEGRYECQIKLVYSESRGEYEGMVNYLAMKGTNVEGAAPYIPEQNGVAKRPQKTLMDMARSMHSHTGLPAQFCAEAMTTASEIRNHIGRKASRMKTPI